MALHCTPWDEAVVSREVIDLVWLILGKQALDVLLVENTKVILLAIRVMNAMPSDSNGVDSLGPETSSK